MFVSWDDEVTNTLSYISLYTVKFLMFMCYMNEEITKHSKLELPFIPSNFSYLWGMRK
jgi:hypothetical protein